MTSTGRNPFRLWEELKERKVVRVMTVYTASAFAILQAVDMIFPRIGLPSWTISLVMILLGAGLVAAIILSWIYDITPGGIKKTDAINPYIIAGSPGENVISAGNNVPGNISADEKSYYADKIRKYRKKERIYSFSSLTVILLVIVLFLFYGGSSVPFNKHDWVVISDFENLTQDPIFDKSLYTAFTIAVNQSRHVNVFSRERMIETLQRMKTKYVGNIDEKTGREIAEREGIKIFIAPSISEIGNNYVITAKILDAATGNLLKPVMTQADDKNAILKGLDRLSRRIRLDLGESRYLVSMQDKPLSKVTTSSLEALKQFSLGIESHYRLDFEAAKNYYENALRIDTGFVSAKASLGNILYERFDTVEGKKLLRQAVRYAGNLTDKEKYGILAFYEVNVNHNLMKGIENEKILTGLYPDDPAYRNNLGWYYQKAGRYEDAVNEYKKAVSLNPNQALTYGGLIWIYLGYIGNSDSALIWSKKMIRDNPGNAWSYFYAGCSYCCLDSIEKSLAYFSKAYDLNPGFLFNAHRLSYAYSLLGKYDDAIQILEKIMLADKQDLTIYYEIGVNYRDWGKVAEAQKYFKKFEEEATRLWIKQYPDLAETYITLGVAASRLNEKELSEQYLRKALSIDTTLNIRYAEIFCQQNRIDEAIEQVRKALAKGYRDLYWLKVNPDIRELQKKPAYLQLLEQYF